MTEQREILTIEKTAEIVSSYVRNNSIASADVPNFIRQVYAVLSDPKVSNEPADARAPDATVPLERALQPVVSIEDTIHPDYLICLEDGLRFKSLKRHLKGFDLTPNEYRVKWGLPEDYPMVAPNYAEARSTLAKKIGLGRKPESSSKAKPNGAQPKADAPARKAPVPIQKSITSDYLICLEDGRKFKSLKRHLKAFNLTPDQYRAKWGLPEDYPMVAPAYAEARSELAKRSGLGRTPRRAAAEINGPTRISERVANPSGRGRGRRSSKR
jgi:predicted transcriptional regulator